MLYIVVAFLAGMIVMDLMWAWKLGIPQAMYQLWQQRNDIVQPLDYARE